MTFVRIFIAVRPYQGLIKVVMLDRAGGGRGG